MALRKCKECGGKVSSKAKTCPSCGAPHKKSTSAATGFIAIVLVVVTVVLCAEQFNFDSFSSRAAPNRRQSEKSNPLPDKNAPGNPSARNAVTSVDRPKAMKKWDLEIETLKLHQPSRSHAAVDVRFINSSPNRIQHWSIDLEVYDKGGNYLGRGEGMVSHIDAGQSKVEEIVILDAQATRIGSWKATLGGVVGYSGLREDNKYELRVKK